MTIVLIIVLKKDDNHPPTPPGPDPGDDTYDPYEVITFDDANMNYTMRRDANIAFEYPYKETFNNKLINTIEMKGNQYFGNSALKLAFSPSQAKAVEKTDKEAPAAPPVAG